MSGVRRVGSADEDAVADYLLGLGWTLLGRRVKMRRGELDLVALDGDVLVIVEVRRRDSGITPEASVDAAKIEKLQHAVQEFVKMHSLQSKMVRYDLVGVQSGEMRHHQDAFRLN